MGGKSPAEAQAVLKGTVANFKNELLFSQFAINYNDLPARFKKGSVVIRQQQPVGGEQTAGTAKSRSLPTVMHVDVIRDDFWERHPEILL
jgi:tRNA(His) guanylyltransferase